MSQLDNKSNKYPFNPQQQALLPIIGSQQEFPVRRIYCVGRNYAEHAQEMGHTGREAPFFFCKPSDAIVVNPSKIQYPSMTQELHHEVELVIAISQAGFEISLEDAWQYVYGYALGIDLTKRDLQKVAKEKGRPWDLSKGFDQSAPISPLLKKSEHDRLTYGEIKLSIDGQIRQQANIDSMIWSIAEIICELSRYEKLEAGDLIFTGTPSGVGEIKKGQQLSAQFADQLKLDFIIA